MASNTPIFKHGQKAGHFCRIFIDYDLVERKSLKENHFRMKKGLHEVLKKTVFGFFSAIMR
jgi:hypothetical protein